MFERHFDAVVMLTWSNWKTEARSNRYHYATRFARRLPVVFVQPDQPEFAWSFEATEHPGLDLLHVGETWTFGEAVTGQVAEALASRGIVRPLLWIYSLNLAHAAVTLPAALKVYHATEDYFVGEYFGVPPTFVEPLRGMLPHLDLLVACSPGVMESYVRNGPYSGPGLVLPNGCDSAFYAPAEADVPALAAGRDERVAFYQGNINNRLDWELLHGLARALPDWTLRFAGRVDPQAEANWAKLLARPNVEHLGMLDPEGIRAWAHRSTVGLIPFVENEYHITRMLPLKAFEYVACGLPVASIPIRSLAAHPELFRLASGAGEFARALRELAPLANEPSFVYSRIRAAGLHSYDVRFDELSGALAQAMGRRPVSSTVPSQQSEGT